MNYCLWFWYGYREVPASPSSLPPPDGHVMLHTIREDMTPKEAMWEVLDTCNIGQPCLLAASLCDWRRTPLGPVAYAMSSDLPAVV